MASAEDVRKLAALARIDIPEEKLAAFAAEFDGIIAYIGQLDALAIDVSKAPEAPAVRNVFREDGEPHAAGKHTDALVGAFPDKEGDSLKVKQIIQHD